jgi:hypothetical protein
VCAAGTPFVAPWGCAARKDIQVVKYVGEKRNVETFEKTDIKKSIPTDSVSFKSNGVYVISGGLGGVGEKLAKHLSKTYQANLILLGRSKLDEEKIESLQAIKGLGGSAVYVEANVSDLQHLKAAIQKGKDLILALPNSQFLNTNSLPLNGVIHAAGQKKDALIEKKTESEYLDVISPKVLGLKNLDEATKDEVLDFFVMFSSISSVIGNLGQCDYAYGNEFMDLYAKSKNEELKAKSESPKYLSINWPLWDEGSMQVDEQSRAMMKRMYGMDGLGTEEGLEVLSDVIHWMKNGGESQVIVFKGEERKIEKLLGAHTQNAALDVNRVKKTKNSSEQTVDDPIQRALVENTNRDMAAIFNKVMGVSDAKLRVVDWFFRG